jgi:hypothetical protein
MDGFDTSLESRKNRIHLRLAVGVLAGPSVDSRMLPDTNALAAKIRAAQGWLGGPRHFTYLTGQYLGPAPEAPVLNR